MHLPGGYKNEGSRPHRVNHRAVEESAVAADDKISFVARVRPLRIVADRRISSTTSEPCEKIGTAKLPSGGGPLESASARSICTTVDELLMA